MNKGRVRKKKFVKFNNKIVFLNHALDNKIRIILVLI